MYANKRENRITFRIKKGYFLWFFVSEVITSLGTTKNKITKDENGENVPHFKITKVVSVHCNIGKNNYQHDSRVV